MCWHKIIFRHAPFIRLNGRILILGDGTKVSKESRHMPGAEKLCQESEDSSKPQFIHGHMFGGSGTVIGNSSNSFCIPLDLNIQEGLKETASRDNGNLVMQLPMWFKWSTMLMKLPGPLAKLLTIFCFFSS